MGLLQWCYWEKALCKVSRQRKATSTNSVPSPSPMVSLALAELGTVSELMPRLQSMPVFTVDQRHQDRWTDIKVPWVQAPLYSGKAHHSGWPWGQLRAMATSPWCELSGSTGILIQLLCAIQLLMHSLQPRQDLLFTQGTGSAPTRHITNAYWADTGALPEAGPSESKYTNILKG